MKLKSISKETTSNNNNNIIVNSNIRNEERDYISLSTAKNSRRNFLQKVIQSSLLISSTTIVAAKTPILIPKAHAAAVETIVSPTGTIEQQQKSKQYIPTDPINPNLIQFETAGMIPRRYFEENRSIYGFVERVTDGDTFRITHVPEYLLNGKIPQPIQKRGISDITIAIRLYGIDAPEIAKNKNQTSQPFGEDSKMFTYNTVFHKMVKVTLLQKDKYGRVIGAVETINDNNKDLSIELAKRGLAELYTGGGAQYWVS